jgi:glutamine synthetase, type I
MFSSYEEVQKFCAGRCIDIVDFKIVDLNGRWHHLSIPAVRLSREIFNEGIGFDGSSYGYSTIEKSDMVFIPDMKTAFIDPFSQTPALSMIADIYELRDGKRIRFGGDPRYVAQKAEDILKKNNVADEIMIGPEFEFYIFDHISYETRHEHQEVTIDSLQAPWNTNEKGENLGYKMHQQDGYHAALPYDVTCDIRNDMILTLEKMGVPVKYHHHEVGAAGQVEIEVEMGSLKEMADRTMIAKYVIKNTAIKYNKTATFMPKPLYGEAGSGMHIHMMLRKDGRNIFYNEGGYSNLSREALFFIGGILKHSPALLGFTNPSTNSYKRLVPGFEAPVSICFGESNRSSVIRVPGYATSPETKRFEFRPSDAAGNPYLSYSALLLGGLDGMVNSTDPVKEGYGPFDVNVFELSDKEKTRIGTLPKSLDEALSALGRDNEFLLKDGVFDRHFIENWIRYKYDREFKPYSTVPTPFEFELYYDI